jgi:alpha-tubulin suppressor-like RCC1 family protein
MRQLLLFTLVLNLVACETEVKNVDSCGDGFIDPGEQCDGADLGDATCGSLGYHGGIIGCMDNCTFDVSSCADEGRCGDGLLQSAHEECDAAERGGVTCSSLGYYGGELSCDTNCQFDTTACATSGICGDGVIQDGQEQCDGGDLKGMTCGDFDYYAGVLGCRNDCTFDFSDCHSFGRCGDGEAQTFFGEDCDGEDLVGDSCATLGYYGGSLACSDYCEFELSSCLAEGRCGDGIIQADQGETCDGANLNGTDCNTLGYAGGTLSCSAECGFNTTVCQAPFVQLTAGESHTCGIKTDGTLWCWGRNGDGQLGIGNTTNQNTPTQLGLDENWIEVSAGLFHSCGRKMDGTLWCWGANNNGQLGLGAQGSTNIPVQVGTGSDWAGLDTGNRFTCGQKLDGSLWCWGHNYFGQLGIGNTVDRFSPVRVGLATDWIDVSAGGYHACGLKTNGTLWCWGWGGSGQLGLGGNADQNIPTQVGVEPTWTEVNAGGEHTCGLKLGNTLWCWGLAGQVGDGSQTFRFSPVQISLGTYWSEVTASIMHTCARKVDNSLYCWGNNESGQLGLGNTTPYYSPTPVGAETNWSEVSAGGYHTCGLKTDGTRWCWGNNGFGQLGTGNTTASRTPVLGL